MALIICFYSISAYVKLSIFSLFPPVACSITSIENIDRPLYQPFESDHVDVLAVNFKLEKE